MSVSAVPGRATSWWRMGRTISPTIRGASPAMSMSRVTVTLPSVLFSMGTIASSTLRAVTDATTVGMSVTGTSSALSP